MGLKRKQMLMRQKAAVVQELKDRKSFLSGKGIKSPRADRDPLVRKLLADIRAVDNRLRLIAENERRTEEMAKIKAERATAPPKDQKTGKGEKSRKAPEEGKDKKIKPEKKAAPPKTPESPKKADQ